MMRRAAYVAALKRERAAIAARPGDHELRLAELDRELSRFADEPLVDEVETAVPGPMSQSRRRGRARAGADFPAAPTPVIEPEGPVV